MEKSKDGDCFKSQPMNKSKDFYFAKVLENDGKCHNSFFYAAVFI
jgi:hypothetical protein